MSVGSLITLGVLSGLALIGYPYLPNLTPARAFYVLQATLAAALFLFLLLPRPTGKRLKVLAFMSLCGATMEALTAICGLAFYWGKGPLPAPAGGAMCEAAHPQAFAWVVIAACCLLLALVRTR